MGGVYPFLAISDNGFVSNYFYDAAGERTVKMSGDGEGVLVNGVLSGARTGTTKFTAYISPYLVVNNGGNYSKHIYMGSQRIASKLSNSGIFSSSPVNSTDLQTRLALQTTKIKERFDSLGVIYKGTAQTGGLLSGNPVTTASSYFYHSDHLGSSSPITDASGGLVQHLEYIPFGEVFIDERPSASSWSTPYKFNAKELDEETGLYYYGARYYDPRTSIWISVDPLKGKTLNVSSYVYCYNNPVRYIDPDGRYSEKWISDLSKGVYKFFHPSDKNIGESLKNKWGQWGFSHGKNGGAYVQYGLGGYKGYYGEHIYGNGHSEEQILRKSGNQGPSIDAKDFASEGFGVVIGWIKNIFSKKQPEENQNEPNSNKNEPNSNIGKKKGVEMDIPEIKEPQVVVIMPNYTNDTSYDINGDDTIHMASGDGIYNNDLYYPHDTMGATISQKRDGLFVKIIKKIKYPSR